MAHRLDYDLLSDADPFELDSRNRPHLVSHGFSEDDLWDIWTDDPRFYEPEADGPADWLMLGEVPGESVLMAPLAKPTNRREDQARPIGVYRPKATLIERYYDDEG